MSKDKTITQAFEECNKFELNLNEPIALNRIESYGLVLTLWLLSFIMLS